jgi:hypothetical protein
VSKLDVTLSKKKKFKLKKANLTKVANCVGGLDGSIESID